MFLFKSLKTYFSVLFIISLCVYFGIALFGIRYSFDRDLSAYADEVQVQMSEFADYLYSRESGLTESVFSDIASSQIFVSSVRFESYEFNRSFESTVDVFQETLLGYGDSQVRGTAFGSSGAVVTYSFPVSQFALIWKGSFLFYLVFLFVGFIILSLLYLAVMHVVQSIVRVKDAAIAVAGGSVKKVAVAGRDELAILGTFFNEVVDSLKNISGDLEDRERIKSELGLAVKIQNNLIPKKAPQIKGLDLAVKTRSAAEIGGDVFDFLHDEGGVTFFIGDATGHGVPAGLVMTMTDTLVHSLHTIWSDLKLLVSNMNRVLYDRTDPTMFITCILFHYDFSTQAFSYCGAGHEQIFIYRAEKDEVEVITPGGIAVGMMPDISSLLSVSDLTLEEGDSFMVFTDGLVEARNADGDLYGFDRAISVFKSACKRDSAEKIMRFVTEDFRQYVTWEGYVQEDDISVIIVRKPRSGEVVGKDLHIGGLVDTRWDWEKK